MQTADQKAQESKRTPKESSEYISYPTLGSGWDSIKRAKTFLFLFGSNEEENFLNS
jgi:hypothetical protein